MMLLAAVLAAAPLELSVLGCEDGEAAELRRIVASELTNSPPRSIVRASVECCPASADVTLELSTHEYAGRLVELGGVPRSLRARTMALALVELVAAHRDPAEDQPLLAPPSLAQARPESVRLAGAAPPPQRTGWAGVAGYSLMAGSTVSLVAAAIFGVQAKALQDRLETAQTDSTGRVVGLTQRDAFAMAQELAYKTRIGEVLLAAAAVTAAAGVALVLFDGHDARVALAPAPGGVALCAAF